MASASTRHSPAPAGTTSRPSFNDDGNYCKLYIDGLRSRIGEHDRYDPLHRPRHENGDRHTRQRRHQLTTSPARSTTCASTTAPSARPKFTILRTAATLRRREDHQVGRDPVALHAAIVCIAACDRQFAVILTRDRIVRASLDIARMPARPATSPPVSSWICGSPMYHSVLADDSDSVDTMTGGILYATTTLNRAFRIRIALCSAWP